MSSLANPWKRDSLSFTASTFYRSHNQQFKVYNKRKSYTTFLKPIVSAEWLRLIWLKCASTPLRERLFTMTCSLPPPPPVPRQQPIHTPPLPHNVWSPQPYVSPPTPVLKPPWPIHSHSHAHHRWQPTRHLWFSSVPLLPVWSDRSEIHLISKCPATSHVALDLI